MYVVVCRGPNCRARGALPLRKRLHDLLKQDASVRLLGYSCFGQCDHGPNVAFYPEGTFYGHLNAGSDADRVVHHAHNEQRIEDEPLRLPECEREQHLSNIGELVKTLERDRARRPRWWWPFS